MPEAAIQAEQLVREFKKGPRAVDGIDLEVSPGEIYGFLGPNGAGKSTTVHMLTTLLPPTSGTARVAGFDIVKEGPKVRTAIGAALQEAALDNLLTGREQVVECGLLERGADRGPHLGALLDDVEARHARGARRGGQERRQHVHRRRLARAVRSQEAVDLT